MSEIEEVQRREYRHSNLQSCILQDPPVLLRLFKPFVQLRKRLDPALYTVFTQAMISQQSEFLAPGKRWLKCHPCEIFVTTSRSHSVQPDNVQNVTVFSIKCFSQQLEDTYILLNINSKRRIQTRHDSFSKIRYYKTRFIHIEI